MSNLVLWTAHKLRKPLWKRYFIVFAAIVHVNVEWPGNSFLNWLDNSGMARMYSCDFRCCESDYMACQESDQKLQER